MLNQAGKLDANAAFALGVVVAGVVVGAALLFGGGGFGKGCPPGRLDNATMDNVLDGTTYTWETLVKDVSSISYDDRGESNHTLFKDGAATNARASINRTFKSASRKPSCFDDTPTVIAVIVASEDLDPYLGVGTEEYKNYFVVWHKTSEDPDSDNPNPRSWHGAILNAKNRTEFPEFTYLANWRKGDKPAKPDTATVPPSELAPIYDACWSAVTPTRRACFGEPGRQVGVGLGIGFGLGRLREGGSEPWVSCAQYGCCCGGSGCHDEM